MLYLTAKDAFIRELNKHFDSKVKVSKRIRVISDLQMFRPKEDPFVWGQKKGRLPEHLMVYWDDVHILTFNETESMDYVLLKFWKGFREAYGHKRVKLVPPWLIEDVKTPTVTEIQLKKLSEMKATTKEEKIAKDIVKDIVTGTKPKKGKYANA